jgi:two-component system response regulator NreC
MHSKASKPIIDGRKKSIHVAVVDDHSLIRHGIISQISRGHRIKIVGEAINGIELFNLLNEVHVDVVLLDMQMPEMNGPQTLHKLKMEYPKLKVLIISMLADSKIIREMIRLGASGYVNKDISGMGLMPSTT